MPHVPSRQRREELIAATIRVMAQGGREAATSRAIAEAAGAPLASIHYTFGSVETLLAAAYARALEAVLARLSEAVPRHQGYAVAFAALADAVADVLTDPASGILFLELNPAHHEQLAEVGERYYTFGHEVVSSVATQSRIAPPAEAEQLGRLIVAAIDGVATRFSVSGDGAAARADLRRLLALLVPAPR